ncbi:hypothetical protein [Flavobacterium psychrophilum]|uniref:hypothetical protein n=2 Tax=Flavobacterium psychrophilum TaxID=96345 RepID=UPI00106B771C|nr:hypothetical protein [Flavobacterium psychrophilum]
MKKAKTNLFFFRLKYAQKLKYTNDYQSFIVKNKEITKSFIIELKREMNDNNHEAVFMLLSLGLQTKKVTRDLEKYWDYCYNNRLVYESYRNLLIQFPKNFNEQKNEIYNELGDIEFDLGVGHFIDVDCHIKRALAYYKKCNAQDKIKDCLSKLEKNKKNTEENYPKQPIEFIIPIIEDDSITAENFETSNSSITRVTRTSGNDLIYKEFNSNEMIKFQLIKQNIVHNFLRYFQKDEEITFVGFLEYLNFQDVWFYNTDIYNVITPALFHFYEILKTDSKNDSQNHAVSSLNYVLPLDSLVLKFEGIIRLLLEKKGINNLIEKNGKTESNNFFKMLDLFQDSIKNETEKERFINNDKPFFDHIFGSDELNLRNEIAHSTFKKEYYSYKKVIYIIDAILRIGKYSIS